ncbi:MAG TPA: bifunctional diguanylate cyclase/phosphodiesterase [Mycobacteriales bacterium]|nr:bifunctional diguanylate cyclase/phosphodiesterase [Mycobacteriales bacterium]
MGVAVVLLTGFGGRGTVRGVADISEMVFAAGAAATAGWRAYNTRGRLRLSWAALAGGCGGWALGEGVWSWYELVVGRATPFPSLADLGFLLFPVGASVALALRATRVSTGDRRRSLLDSLTVTASLTVVSWTTALGAVADARDNSLFSFVVSMGYPALDLAVLTLLVIVLSRSTSTRVGLVLVGLGIAAIALADSAFAYLTATGTYETGVIADLGWVVGFALLMLAPVFAHPAPEDGADVASHVAPSRLPYVPVVLALTVVVSGLVQGRTPDLVVTSLAGLTVALVLLRQYSFMCENAQLVTTLSEREEQLRHQAFHDALTGLANRALFQDRVMHALDLHRRDMRSLAVLFCDLDDFKLVNDTLGHQVGDELLVRVAERLRGALRSGDTLARLGGDEFAVLLEDGGDPWSVARQVVDVMASSFTAGGRALAVHASVGLTVVEREAPTPTAATVLAQADTAMYAAKRTGKGCFRAFEPGMELTEVRDESLRRRLSSALAQGRISLVYQPIMDMTDGVLLGFEALARWKENGQDVPPDVFVPGAERTGLIGALTELVLDQVCAQVAAWDRAGVRRDFTVAMNVSPRTVVDRAFPDQVMAALRRHGVPAGRLVLEITESGLLTDLDAAHDVTRRLDAHGIGLSLDDFGTGYSSLTHLSRIPLRSLKIDQAFVEGLDRDERQSRFTDALLRFGANLGLEVIAEGVERVEQLDRLRQLGCDRGQGFLLGRPAPALAWDALLAGSAASAVPRPRSEAPATTSPET